MPLNKRISSGAAVAALAVGAVLVTGPSAGADTAPTVVTVHADQSLATVSDAPVGTNDWDSDAHLRTPSTAPLLRADGLRVRELNSGPYDDVYRWQTNTDDSNPITNAIGPDQPVPWQSWVRQTEQTGAQPMIHVNYGSTATDGPGGTDIGPQEAAAWVRQANIVDHDHIEYWAIGEEVWGNGFYSSIFPAFEPDNHADKSPTAYGENAAKFAEAMKAVDPSIKVGVEISPFDTAGPAGSTLPDWNAPLLKAAGSAIDFVDMHWYSFNFTSNSDTTLFANPRQIPAAMAGIRASIARNSGPGGNHIQVIVGETNSESVQPGVQSVTTPDALFAADDVATWLEQGAADVNWFATHIAAVPDAVGAPDDPDGTGYGDWGLLSSGVDSCAKNAKGVKVCEPPLNTPFPAYYGLQLATRLAGPGATFVQTSVAGGGPLVTHAAVQRNGDLVVLIENEDPTNAHQVRLNYTGYQPFPVALGYTYGRGSTGVSISVASSGCVQLAPYSLTELVLHRS